MRFVPLLLLILLFPSFTVSEVILGCHDKGFDLASGMLEKSQRAKVKRVPVSKSITSPLGVSLDGLTTASVEAFATWCTVDLMLQDGTFLLIAINGEIRAGDADVINNIMRTILLNEQVHNKNVFIYGYLNSLGGDVYEAMKIGRIFASRKLLSTWVDFGNACASSCVLILVGGNKKQVYGNVAIHRPEFTVHSSIASMPQEHYRKLYDNAMNDVRVYLKEMGIRSELADEMMRYSSDDMHILTKQELAYYGVNQENPYAYEQEKASWIARCGKDWWELKQTIDNTIKDKCNIRNFYKVENGKGFLDSEQYSACRYAIEGPFYKVCGIELPKK